MADQQHLSILKLGVEAWNHWREENPDIKPELNDVDLSGMQLHKANLYQAYLVGSNLSRADLSCSNLRQADLSRANLSRANLNNADLSEAWLIESVLKGASFVDASLSWANMYDADISEADFGGENQSLMEVVKSHKPLFFSNLDGLLERINRKHNT